MTLYDALQAICEWTQRHDGSQESLETMRIEIQALAHEALQNTTTLNKEKSND